jgi:hypothetical protein
MSRALSVPILYSRSARKAAHRLGRAQVVRPVTRHQRAATTGTSAGIAKTHRLDRWYPAQWCSPCDTGCLCRTPEVGWRAATVSRSSLSRQN